MPNFTTKFLNKEHSPSKHNVIKNNKKYPVLFLPTSRKIAHEIPPKADPLFCTFDKAIADHISNVGGFCIFLCSKVISNYDLNFFRDKEVWIYHLSVNLRHALSHRFAYALLRHGARKVQVDWFPLEGVTHD